MPENPGKGKKSVPAAAKKSSKRRAKRDTAAIPQITISRELCKGCGICVAFCPQEVLELDEEEKAVVKRPEACTACRACELRCPDLAIEIED